MSNIQSKLKEAWVKIKSGLIQVLGANLVNKIVAVLSNMVITRVLSTSDYGTWSYVLNQYTYLSIVSALGLLYGALQFGTEHKGKEKAFTYFRYCLKYGLYISCFGRNRNPSVISFQTSTSECGIVSCCIYTSVNAGICNELLYDGITLRE